MLIQFEFGPNDYFSDAVLSKTFTHQPGGSGLCSVPVDISWKSGKDLTEGASAAAAAAFEERKEGVRKGPAEAVLQRLMESGPSSFFNWFLWTGAHEALGEVHEHGGCDGHHHHDGEDESPVEVFPNAEDLAVQIAEDLYPNAPKYFSMLFHSRVVCVQYIHVYAANSRVRAADAVDDEDDEDDDDGDDIDLESDVDEDNAAGMLAAYAGKKGKRNGADEEDGPAKKKSRK